MITCNLMGGLGNQIFQIFATISYAIKSRNQFKFLNLHQLGSGSTTVRYTFWNTFFSNLKPFLVDVLPEPIYCIKERDFTYTEIPIYEIVNSVRVFEIKQKLQILNNFRHLYYCLKYKKQFRKWLWEKVREVKIQQIYHPNYLIENLREEDDLDTVLNYWK